VVTRCLERRREDRYPSAVELARALAPFAERRPGSYPGEQLILRTMPLSDDMVQCAIKAAREADSSVDTVDGPPTVRVSAA
jgi:hypothetical protein